MQQFRLWMTRFVVALFALFLVSLLALLVYQQFSDGPSGPLSGGSFTSGTPTPITDWSALAGDFEFELVAEGTSRTAGGIELDGVVYISCDLGFMWSRLPSGTTRHLLNLIYVFKDWHHKALADGRIRIRKGGKIYDARIELEEDPATIAALQDKIEVLASEFFGADVGPRPTEPPNDIWFFRINGS